jgi:hypothetical protein
MVLGDLLKIALFPYNKLLQLIASIGILVNGGEVTSLRMVEINTFTDI